MLKQDKGRGVVILNKSDYIEKCEDFLKGTEFKKLSKDHARGFQSRVQRVLLGMKSKFDITTYKKLYPSSSQPGLFFGMAKVHKLKSSTEDVTKLPLRPVISNIGTSTYEIAKHLAKILTPLTKSAHNIESTSDFISKLAALNIDKRYQMVSLDVVSLFTSVPLDFTINIILNKIFNEKLIETKLNREEFKKLLELSTKEMHFSFNGTIYKQINGVAMGSPLGPVLANIFMVELETTLVPTLGEKMSVWLRYVDDTFTFIKENEIENVKEVLNKFHKDIKFTHEVEVGGAIAFLDVNIKKQADGTFETEVYRKKTDTSIFLNWKSYAPKSWKIGTIKGLFRRAYIICSNKEALEKEIKFLKNVFGKVNGYPSRVVSRALFEISKHFENVGDFTNNTSNQNNEQVTSNEGTREGENSFTPYIALPYKGEEGEGIMNKFRNYLKGVLPSEVKPRFTYKGEKLVSFFRIKDKVSLEHQSNLVYGYYPREKVNGKIDYVDETNVRYGARTYEHCFTDKQSAVYKHAKQNKVSVTLEEFKVLEKGYDKYKDRKIAESLYIKELKPILNAQVNSHKIELFN